MLLRTHMGIFHFPTLPSSVFGSVLFVVAAWPFFPATFFFNKENISYQSSLAMIVSYACA